MTSRITLALALAGSIIPATAPAQQCAFDKIRPSTSKDQFVIDAEKETVLDTKTGLMWKRCVEGQSGTNCIDGAEIRLAWNEALKQATVSTHAGYKDWRIPNVKELKSLVEVACIGPAINEEVFPNTPGDWTWSSSRTVSNTGGAWFVSFYYGRSERSGNFARGLAVRLVRGGQ